MGYYMAASVVTEIASAALEAMELLEQSAVMEVLVELAAMEVSEELETSAEVLKVTEDTKKEVMEATRTTVLSHSTSPMVLMMTIITQTSANRDQVTVLAISRENIQLLCLTAVFNTLPIMLMEDTEEP